LFYDGSLKGRRVLAARAGAALGYSCRLSGHLTPSTPAPPPHFSTSPAFAEKANVKDDKKQYSQSHSTLEQGGASRSASTGHMSNEALHGFQQAAA
jgi:hypothetical protein